MNTNISESDNSEYQTHNINSINNIIKCSYKSPLFGGYLLLSSPCYSSCGSYIFVSNSSRIHVYNSRDLSYKFVISIRNTIIKTFVYCSTHDYLLVLTNNGHLIVFTIEEDYSNYEKFAEYSFTGVEILDMKITKFGVIFFVTRDKTNVVGICRLQLNFTGITPEIIESKDDLDYICRLDADIGCFAISYTGELIAVSISKLLLIFKIDSMSFINQTKTVKCNKLEMYSTISIHQITSLEFHPRLNYLACGDITGKVITWHIKFTNADLIDITDYTIYSKPFDSIISRRINNESSHKRMGLYYIVYNPTSIIPLEIAKVLLATEELARSDMKMPKIPKVESSFGRFFGMLEFDIKISHWHAHAVNSLVFTNCGRFMLTGGEEAVVVIWDLENDTKRFITRLDSTIFSIVISSVDNIPTQYLVTCGNNSVKIFDPILLLLKHTIYGVQVPISMSISNYNNSKGAIDHFSQIDKDTVSVSPSKRKIFFQALDFGAGIPYGLVALSISGIRLQFYSLISGLQHAFLDFIDTNYVSRSQEDFGFSYLVEEICISRDCTRIVSSSFRNVYHTLNNGDSNHEKRVIRFWHKTDDFAYKLNTQINNAHFNRVINIFQLDSDVFATVSTKDWKLWSLNTDFAKWTCMHAGSFKGYNNVTSCISPDKTLLAVSHGCHLSFWSIGLSREGLGRESLTREDSSRQNFTREDSSRQNFTRETSLLVHRKLSDAVINRMSFVGKGHLLVATVSSVSIWNLLSGANDPIHSHSNRNYTIVDLNYSAELSIFVVISAHKKNTRLEVFRLDLQDYSFKSIHVEEQAMPRGFLASCLAKVPLYALINNTAEFPESNVSINGFPVERIIRSSEYSNLMVVMFNNLEFKTYVIGPDLVITPCEYFTPVKDKVPKRPSLEPSFTDRTTGYMAQPIKRPSVIRPFDEDCPTFALPSPSVVFHRMARSLLKSNNIIEGKNGLSNGTNDDKL